MNIRSKVGKRGWDFSIIRDRLVVEDLGGRCRDAKLTKTEKLVHDLGYQSGYQAGQASIKNRLREAFGGILT